MLALLITLSIIAISSAVIGFCLHRLNNHPKRAVDTLDQLANDIDNELPQLQCGECGYAGCKPYAIAIAKEEANINLCHPGGTDTAKRLANLLNTQTPVMPPATLNCIATIKTQDCIGCGLCLLACPTDAIVGAKTYQHWIIAKDCVGCRLCLPVCPVDCIDLIDRP